MTNAGSFFGYFTTKRFGLLAEAFRYIAHENQIEITEVEPHDYNLELMTPDLVDRKINYDVIRGIFVSAL